MNGISDVPTVHILCTVWFEPMDLDETAADGPVLDDEGARSDVDGSDEDQEEGNAMDPVVRGLAPGVTQPQDALKGAHIGDTDELVAALLGRGANAAAVEHISTMERRLKLRGATEEKIYVSGSITCVPDVMQAYEMEVRGGNCCVIHVRPFPDRICCSFFVFSFPV